MNNGTWDNVNKLSTASRILRYIFRNTPVSRAGIAAALGLSPAMVTSQANVLISQGIVEDLGEAVQNNSSSGRRRMLIGLSCGAKRSIGVEISKNAFHFCMTTLSGETALYHHFSPDEEQFRNVNETIISHVNLLISQTKTAREDIVGIGIALPGHFIEQTGKFVSHSGLWKNFDAGFIARETGLPVVCENNVRSMAYEKYIFGRDESPENFVFIHAGAGIFCAIFTDGRLITSDNFISGEIGHTISNPDGQQCECGKCGCLQTYASESWILQKARTIYRNSPGSALRSLAAGEEDITLGTVLGAYELGDQLVSFIIQDAIKYLSISVANIAIIMSPQKIYLHSRLFQSEAVRRGLHSYIDSQLLFVEKSYTEEISLLDYNPAMAAGGAAAMAIDRLFIQNLP